MEKSSVLFKFALVIELERHITKLLLTNDCVIVPDFGGFMTHHIDSIYDHDAKTFYPPLRTLGFNPQLKINDSLLVQSYVEVYDISYPEALTRIENDVTRLKGILAKNGEYELYGLGVIYIQDDGSYDFKPCEAGILTPDYYGLSTFSADIISNSHKNTVEKRHKDSISRAESEIKTIAVAPESEEKGKKVSKEKTITLNIPIASIKEIAAACIIFVLFFLIPSPVGENSTSGITKSRIDTNMLLNIMPKDITLGTPKFKPAKEPAKCADGIKKDCKATAISDSNKTGSTYFSIVLASKVSKKNAEAYVRLLHKKGFEKAEVYTTSSGSKVIYDKFATRKDANRILNMLNTDIDFSDAWITSITEK